MMIEYNVKEIEFLNNKINSDYNDIIDILDFFKLEKDSIYEVINTPKSKKVIDCINNYFIEINQKTKDKQIVIKKEFDYIINEYQNLLNYIENGVKKL